MRANATDDSGVAIEDPEPISEAVRDKLSKQPTRDTAPEVALRRELHGRGLRYRVDQAPLASMRSRRGEGMARGANQHGQGRLDPAVLGPRHPAL